jgi:hypothetical protein
MQLKMNNRVLLMTLNLTLKVLMKRKDTMRNVLVLVDGKIERLLLLIDLNVLLTRLNTFSVDLC